MNYLPIIGIEIHVQLRTKTKMFCGCSASIWKAEPNTHVCPVCLGLPGALPVMNKKAIGQVIKMGLALDCEINHSTYFERKNYFYPDLPKGYQISQHRAPLCINGQLSVDDTLIRISDVHLEEDTGKSVHKKGATDNQESATRGNYSLLDFNKSGIPLMEIVSAPDIYSADQAVKYCKSIQQIVRSLNISDADIEKGQMRFEVNISLREVKDEELPNYRVEIKNLNSFKFVKKVIEYETKRQTKAFEQGKKLIQETRGFDEDKEITVSQREKEAAHDYRYFPEPDLPPLEISETEIEKLKNEIPELPYQAIERLVNAGLKAKDAEIIVQKQKVDYLDNCVIAGFNIKEASLVIIHKPNLTSRYGPQDLRNHLQGKRESVVEDTNKLESIIIKVITENPKTVRDFQTGKEKSLQFLIGQVMKETKGKANPRKTSVLLQKHLT
ncbi:Asp-tRNA(Asn)/Glu-tRNA(Gln) amidotransferase subunit GatB [Patescibacteria group bacterium]|nr:Asp-tRNA(Asn)/Glu-tRNA(Gln) amidotransferase subunit GatB [Patescibacteria group bacterium]MBU1868746.1 Asp-tRNA(Asn)/Glu-tRNA(Gln) amidotransferase subunit GatB [Patescibacteria group bacterium]